MFIIYVSIRVNRCNIGNVTSQGSVRYTAIKVRVGKDSHSISQDNSVKLRCYLYSWHNYSPYPSVQIFSPPFSQACLHLGAGLTYCPPCCKWHLRCLSSPFWWCSHRCLGHIGWMPLYIKVMHNSIKKELADDEWNGSPECDLRPKVRVLGEVLYMALSHIPTASMVYCRDLYWWTPGCISSPEGTGSIITPSINYDISGFEVR